MALTGVDHKRLVEAHIDGDEEAFSAIVRAYYESLFAHALRRTGDAHAAEDAVQETLSRAYRALPRFSGDYQMRAWLHRILTNVCHDEGRRRQRESRTFERVAATHREEPPVDHDLALLDLPRHEVLDALAALPASYRDALVLRYVQELSFHDVAEATGISEGNARLRVHRGRAALRRALAPLTGIIVFLAPFLRRGQRAALAAQMSAETQVGLVASAPVATRVAESSVTFVDKAPSLPSMIGVAASLVVPAALPVISDQVANHVTPRPAAVAGPFDAEPDGTEQDSAAPTAGPAATTARAAAGEAGSAPVARTTVPPGPTTTTTTTVPTGTSPAAVLDPISARPPTEAGASAAATGRTVKQATTVGRTVGVEDGAAAGDTAVDSLGDGTGVSLPTVVDEDGAVVAPAPAPAVEGEQVAEPAPSLTPEEAGVDGGALLDEAATGEAVDAVAPGAESTTTTTTTPSATATATTTTSTTTVVGTTDGGAEVRPVSRGRQGAVAAWWWVGRRPPH